MNYRMWHFRGEYIFENTIVRMQIAICDDEQNQIDYMSSIVASWSAHAGHNCEIRTFASAEAFLFEYEEDKAFDILLLDIEMENIKKKYAELYLNKKDN